MSAKKAAAPARSSAVRVVADGPGSSVAPSADDLPDTEAIAALLRPVQSFALGSNFARVRGFLHRLAKRPPQVLLLEGGAPESRLAAAHYWTLLLNCRDRSQVMDRSVAPAHTDAAPCFTCPDCIRMVTHLHRDCFFLDGTAGSIKIDEVRALRGVLGEPPREAFCRMVIFREAQSLMEAAANALLKSFEEPRPATSFILLAPQRERLLPTLVSRSLVLTLPWLEGSHNDDESLASWVSALCLFAESGRGWFERTGLKGAVDAPLVHSLLSACRRALAARLIAVNDENAQAEGLEIVFSRLPLERLRMLDEVLAECQDSLIYTVNPTIVLEWLATRIYLLSPRR